MSMSEERSQLLPATHDEGSTIIPQTWFRRRWRQWWTLFRKNMLIAWRHKGLTASQVLAPVLIILLLWLFQQMTNSLLSLHDVNPKGELLGAYPKCTPPEGYHQESCITIKYAPGNITWVDNYMKNLSTQLGLEYGKDVVPVINGSSMVHSDPGNPLTAALALETDYISLNHSLLTNPNLTQNVLLFTSAYFEWEGITNINTTSPSMLGYILYYNMTTGVQGVGWNKPGPGDYNAMVLKKSVDQLFLQKRADQENAVINATIKPYPEGAPRFDGLDVFAVDGGLWLYIPPMVTFFVVLTEVVAEKQERKRLGMHMMGMLSSMYWGTWWVFSALIGLMGSLVLLATGYAFQFDFFTNSDPFCVLIVFTIFSWSVIPLGTVLSTLCSTIKSAQAVGYAVILVGFVFQAILCTGYGILVYFFWADTLPGWVMILRIIFEMYPPFNFCKAFFDISIRSSKTIDMATGTLDQGPGFHWHNFWQSRKLENPFGPDLDITLYIPSTAETMGVLILNGLVYIALTWYLDGLFGADRGDVRRRWYFPFTREYWGVTDKRGSVHNPYLSEDASGDVVDEDVAAEADAVAQLGDVVDSGEYCAVFKDMWKVYEHGNVKALQGVNLRLQLGECFVLLGHNGAGKTTTISILSGLFPPSHGTAKLFNSDVRLQPDRVRRLLGVCPQHDIIWDELTAAEHLRLFANLKGVRPDAIEREIHDRLEEVDLGDVIHKRVGQFSGGMKRRMSVAMATIGSPKLIILDEPTTGMDPVNRQHVWRLIQKMKEDRLILLSTHSMEEADVLGDRIGIMAFGKMRALGTPLRLKKRFGSGYRIHISGTQPQIRDFEATLTKSIADGSGIITAARNAAQHKAVTREGRSERTYAIPANESAAMETLLASLEDGKVVDDWGVALTMMEDVFLKVTKDAHFNYGDEEETDQHEEAHGSAPLAADDKPAAAMDDNEDTPLLPMRPSVPVHEAMARKSHPFRAVLSKNWHLQKRQTGTNCCQIITPVLVVGLMIILQQVIKSELPDSNTHVLFAAPPVPLNHQLEFPFNTSSNASFAMTGHTPSFMTPSGALLSHTLDEWNKRNNCLIFFDAAIGPDVDADVFGELTAAGVEKGFLGFIPQHNCSKYFNNYTSVDVQVPYFEMFPTYEDYDQLVSDDILKLNNISFHDLNKPENENLLPDGTFYTRKLQVDAKGVYIDYDFSVNDLTIVNYHRPNNFTRWALRDIEHGDANRAYFLVLETEGKLALMDLVDRALMEMAMSVNASDVRETDDVLPEELGWTWIQRMPFYSQFNLMDTLELLGTVLYPVALSLQLPVFLFITVMEKEGRLRELMKSMGLKLSSYYLANYVYNFIIYIAVAAFFWGASAAAQLRFWSQTTPSVLFVFFFGWGLSLVSMSFLIASVIQTRRAATAIGYGVALVGSLMTLVVCVGIYGDWTYFSLDRAVPQGYYLWAQFAFTRGVYLMNNRCVQQFACYPSLTSAIESGDELWTTIWWMYLDAILYMIVALYIDAVNPARKVGVARHPLLCLQPKGNRLKKEHMALQNVAVETPSDIAEGDQLMLEDVRAEAENVDNIASMAGELDRWPLVVDRLSKTFTNCSPPKVAVNNLSLSVGDGEFFGFLGENGAGKTTTISILTGVYPPSGSDGTAYVGGCDIRTQMDKVQLLIGVCPQHSVLWDYMTVEEHLMFYARIKGVPSKRIRHEVQRLMHDVGLDKFAKRQSRHLSGGMQRRLSVAIALTGQSRVIFLDEPTAGLDPVSRRQLWTILSKCQRDGGRAFILTTHNLDEVELLCGRIGIMAQGQLRAIGGLQQLRSRFADYYRLLINFDPSREAECDAFVRSQFPDTKCLSAFRGSRCYHLPRSHARLSKLFRVMMNDAVSVGIEDWGVNQVGLLDVFEHVYKLAHHQKQSSKQAGKSSGAADAMGSVNGVR